MNTNPDETKLAMWLDDELTGSDFAEMEAWAATQPEQLEAREELRKYRETLSANIPASEEPPYPDFFMTRVQQGIRDMQVAETKLTTPAPKAAVTSFWKSWLLPVAACAGMVIAFNIGRQGGTSNTSVVKKTSPVLSSTPVVYTPEEGVDAEWYASGPADATIIVLAGVSAIPDSTDFSQTVYVPTIREADRTATREVEKSGATKQ